jgi:hypothetical protein
VSGDRVKVLGLNATFNNISVISWWRKQFAAKKKTYNHNS